MRFEELLARADTGVLSKLMPAGTTELVTAIDSSLAYPRRLAQILLKLRPANVLLDTATTRNDLLMIMPHAEAKKLAQALNCNGTQDPFSEILAVDFTKKVPRSVLYQFLGIDLPEEGGKPSLQARKEVQPNFGLFAHQSNALRRIEALLAVEPHKVLLHMPTGSGKTRTAMNAVANYLRSRERGVVIWLAHSEELCEQASEEFTRAWEALGSRKVPLIRYWGPYDSDLRSVDDGIVIAGLRKAFSKLISDDHQLRALSAKDPLVIMDEAHQAIAPTYQMLIEHLMRPAGNSRLLGLSATPGRTWNDPEADRKLAEFFACRKVSLRVDGFENPVSYLISMGYLAKPDFKFVEAARGSPLTELELKTIRDTFELPNSVLDGLALDQQRNLLIVQHAEDLLRRHRRVILFAASVQQSDLLAAVLAARGHWARSITSKPGSDRGEAIESFKDDADERKILCNYGVLTTGFDAPKTSAALVARPTLSLVLYSQMVGRAMRGVSAGGNSTCEILTVVDPQLPGFGSVAQAFTNWEDVWKDEDTQ